MGILESIQFVSELDQVKCILFNLIYAHLFTHKQIS